MQRAASAAAFAALAASCTPALAHVAPWSSPDPLPLPVQFLIGIAPMAVAGAVILWQGAALARGRERRRFPVMRIALTPRWPARPKPALLSAPSRRWPKWSNGSPSSPGIGSRAASAPARSVR
jgi:hypothetical protein